MSVNLYTEQGLKKIAGSFSGIKEIPQANEEILGGIKASPKTDAETSEVKIDSVTGKLYAKYNEGQTGVTDYTLLTNKPQINGIELKGNKTTTDLGITNTKVKGQNETTFRSGEVNLTQTDLGIWTGTKAEYDQALLDGIIKNKSVINITDDVDEGGGSGGGTTDYKKLTNKPQINNIELSDNKTLDELGIQAKGNYLTEHFIFPNAGSHNGIYRGKNLGTPTDKIYQNISNGTFEDIYVGDYFVVNDIKWLVCGFDLYYQTGDVPLDKHHLVIIPELPLYNYKMNDSNTTSGAYLGSKMYKEGLTQAKTIIKNAFPNHVVKRRTYLNNSVSNGKPNGGIWVDSEVELMNESMVYGSPIYSSVGDGSVNVITNYRLEKTQLPLFNFFRPDLIGKLYWLRDVVSSNSFSIIGGAGVANATTATFLAGVRPFFLIS